MLKLSTGSWVFGMVTDIESGEEMPIRFSSEDRRLVVNIPQWHEIRYASGADHGQNSVTPLNKEPWSTFYDQIKI